MIRKSGHRFSLATNAKRLRGDHAQKLDVQERKKQNEGGEAMQRLAKWPLAAATALVAATGTATAQVKELRIGYQPSPIQDASIAMFETWGAKNGVKIVKVPNSYGVYVEKMTASLTSNSDQYDVIWHNDNWGQTWSHILEPTDAVDGLKYADPWGMSPIIFNNAQGQNTVVPMGQT